MIDDIAMAVDAGVHGVVIGALKPDGNIDLPLVRRLVEAARGKSVTFHRAFDLCRDPLRRSANLWISELRGC